MRKDGTWLVLLSQLVINFHFVCGFHYPLYCVLLNYPINYV